MARSCAIIPRVKNNKGQVVDSKLFKDLLSYTGNNRADAVRIYLITKNDEFVRDWNPKLVLDENNEPTLKSLLQKTNFKSIVPERKILERLNREIGYYKRGTNEENLQKDNNGNRQDLIQKAVSFNQNSDYNDDYVARVIKTKSSNSSDTLIGIRVEKRNRENSAEANDMAYNAALNARLRSILEAKGVTIGALTDLERRMGINGVTDFNTAKNAAKGLIEMIRLADGVRGEKALPEEFAHFAIEAMTGNPLINRLINNLIANNLVHDILGEEYDNYDVLYKGDSIKLAKEAAGKLLAKHLLNQEPITQKPYKNLLERLMGAVKSFFKNLSASQIQRAMHDADKDFGMLAKGILDGSMDTEIDVKNIDSPELFYQTNERVQRDRKLLKDIINNELKRLKIYEKRNPDSQFDVTQQLFVAQLEAELATNNEIDGIYSFIENALETLEQVNKRLKLLSNTSGESANKKAAVLRDVRNYLFSYGSILDEIRDALIQEEGYADNRYGERVRVALDNTTILLRNLESKYKQMAMPLFVEYIKPFMGGSIIIQMGEHKGEIIKAEDLVKRANKDISFFDRWLDSMADSSDYMLKVIDQAVKKSKDTARMDTIDVVKELQAVAIKLEQAGVRNTNWMFERDDNGNLTGFYISEFNQGLFKKRYKEMLQSLEAKYGKNPVGENAEKYKKERQAWFDANMETVDGKRQLRKSIYGNKVYQNLNAAQKEFYNKVMDIKARLDAFLPEHATTLLNAVRIRKDLLERVKSSEDVVSGAKQLWEAVKDTVIRRSDDTGFSESTALKDFEGRVVQELPIYYTQSSKGENLNDLSTDIVSTLAAYADMANNYNQMNKVIDLLELGRDIMQKREIQQTQSDKPLVEKFKVLGRKVESKITKSGDKSRIGERLDNFFESQIYGRYMKDEGTFGKSRVDKGKAANLLNKITAINTTAVNILLAISNVSTGTVMMRTEALSGEFFTESDVIKADRIYRKNLFSFLSEIGNRVKTSKLALWDEYFDVSQEHNRSIKELNFDRKTWFSRMFNTSTLFFLNNAGEHWMSNRTSLALANTYKMKSPSGKIVSLWDAMEVVPIDKNNKKLGAKLQLKQGYTKEDGTVFTKDDVFHFIRRTTAINERMHGIYNQADSNALQRVAVGRMAMMYRNWLKPNLNKRFKSASYNMDLQAWTEGYYLTTGKFLLRLAQDLRKSQFDIASEWKNLNKTEKANIRRAIAEVGQFLMVTVALGLLNWGDDDDKDNPWLKRMAEYQLLRLKTEIGVLIPGKPMLDEGLRVLKSPAAAITTIQSTLDLIGLINPMNYETFAGEDAIIKSGQFKDESKAYRLLMKSPLAPIRNTIIRGANPELVIPYYKQ